MAELHGVWMSMGGLRGWQNARLVSLVLSPPTHAPTHPRTHAPAHAPTHPHPHPHTHFQAIRGPAHCAGILLQVFFHEWVGVDSNQLQVTLTPGKVLEIGPCSRAGGWVGLGGGERADESPHA
jgi:hypothetical protein